MATATKRRLTKKQKGFADKFLETGKMGQSALEVYDVKSMAVAAVIANENIKKPNVKEYLESHAPQAAIRIKELSAQDENLPVALGASKDILDRAGYKPVEKTESLHVHLAFQPEQREKLQLIASKAIEEMTHDEVNG
jgi:phage terminase small subunit